MPLPVHCLLWWICSGGTNCRAMRSLACSLLVLKEVFTVRAAPTIHVVWSVCNQFHWGPIREAINEAIQTTSSACVSSAEEEVAELVRIKDSASDAREVTVILPGNDMRLASHDSLFPLLQDGAAMFFVETGPNVTALGLSSDATRAYALMPNNGQGGGLTGEYICKAAKAPQRIVLIRGPTDFGKERVDSAVLGIQQHCPDAGHKIVATRTATSWNPAPLSQEMKTLFITEPRINAVIACHDEMATMVVKAAEAVRAGGSSGLLVTGFDNSPDVQPYLLNRTVASTVDQRVKSVTDGLVDSLKKVVPLVQAEINGPAPNIPFIVSTPVALIVSDMAALTADRVLEGYNPALKPLGQVLVRVGLLQTRILHVNIGEGVFEVVTDMTAEWVDNRLSWDAQINSEPFQIPADRVWLPNVYVQNTYSSAVISSPPVLVEATGKVAWSRTVRSNWMCTFAVHLYPFDQSTCNVTLTAPYKASDVQLIGDLSIHVVALPKSFELTLSQSAGSYEQQSASLFTLNLKRKPNIFYFRLIIPAFLLNSVGFVAFWIPGPAQACAIGITMLLCTLALRQSAALPTDVGMTWIELFMLFNVAYQAMTLFMSALEFDARAAAAINACVSGCLRRVKLPKRFPAAKKKDDPVSPDDTAVDPDEPKTVNPDDTAVDPEEPEPTQSDKSVVEANGIDTIGRYFVIPSYFILAFLLLAFPHAFISE